MKIRESSGNNLEVIIESLAETGMYRFKILFERDLKNGTFEGQQSEVYVKAKVLNILTSLGMPQSIRKAA